MPPSFPAIQLIPVEESELPLVGEMAAEIWPSAYRDIITEAQTAYMLDLMYSPNALLWDVQESGIRYYWIVNTGERIGYLAFGPMEHADESMLHKCYLLPNHQRGGNGTATMKALFPLLTRTRMATLTLRVNRHNHPAVNFYQKSGFTIESEDILQIGGGFEMDDYIMVKKIPAP